MDSIKGQCPICGGHHLATYHGTKKRPYTGTPLVECKNCGGISDRKTGRFSGSIAASDEEIDEIQREKKYESANWEA